MGFTSNFFFLRRDSQRGDVLQRYMYLQGRQAKLIARLSVASSDDSSSSSSSPTTPIQESATSTFTMSTPPPRRPSYDRRVLSMPRSPRPSLSSRVSSMSTIPEIPETTVSQEQPDDEAPFSADENELYTVNADIKTCLTELLNRDAIRNDDQMRAWVQKRLMDIEFEIRRQRRGRSRQFS